MKLHLPDGKGGINTIEVSDNISLYIENVLEDWTLLTASESVKGGIKVGDGLSINATSGVLRMASRLQFNRFLSGNLTPCYLPQENTSAALSLATDWILLATVF